MKRSVLFVLLGLFGACSTNVVVGQRDGGTGAADASCVLKTCAEQHLECGPATDGCGATLDCGGCPGTSHCGGPRGPSSCCQPRTCRDAHLECGSLDDGCGHLLDCGSCQGSDTCGARVPGVCGRPQCTVDGWCWVRPAPFGQNLNAIFALSQDNLWLGGGDGLLAGVIGHWDGVAWRDETPGPIPGVTGVWAAAPDDVWFSLVDGSVRHFDGTHWTSERVGSANLRLSAISGTSSSDLWVSGTESGANTTVHFDGQQWQRWSLPPSVLALRDIAAVGAGEAWAVGLGFQVEDAGAPDAGGTISLVSVAFRFDGGVWGPVPLANPGTDTLGLGSVWGHGPDDVWLGGDRLVHWDGTALVQVSPSSPWGAPSVLAADPSGSEIWSAGGGGFWLLEAPDWAQVASAQAPTDIAVPAPGEVWAVGRGGTIDHLNGLAVEPMSATLSPMYFWAVDGTETDLWVGGQGDLWHFDGATWSRRLFGGVMGVFAAGNGVAFAVGADGITRCEAALCTVVDGSSSNLFDIHGSSGADIWAVGAVVLHLEPQGWTRRDLPAPNRLSHVFALSPTDAWGSATDGSAWHWDGAGWAQFLIPAFGPLRIWGPSSANLWAVDGISVFHWDGATWTRVTGVPGWPLSPAYVTGVGASDVWVAGVTCASGPGCTGGAAHFDGSTWTAEQLGADRSIYGLHATAAAVWAVGESGLLMRRAR